MNPDTLKLPENSESKKNNDQTEPLKLSTPIEARLK
jgi:hypothetical protein